VFNPPPQKKSQFQHAEILTLTAAQKVGDSQGWHLAFFQTGCLRTS